MGWITDSFYNLLYPQWLFGLVLELCHHHLADLMLSTKAGKQCPLCRTVPSCKLRDHKDFMLESKRSVPGFWGYSAVKSKAHPYSLLCLCLEGHSSLPDRQPRDVSSFSRVASGSLYQALQRNWRTESTQTRGEKVGEDFLSVVAYVRGDLKRILHFLSLIACSLAIAILDQGESSWNNAMNTGLRIKNNLGLDLCFVPDWLRD